jgi:hypothetical protein
MEALVKNRLATLEDGKLVVDDSLAERITFGQLFGG